MLFLLLIMLQSDVQIFTDSNNDLLELRHEVVVDADRQTVWNLFTSKAGVESGITPVAWIDLREGGIMETSYNPDAKPGDPNNIKVKFEMLFRDEKFKEIVRKMFPEKFSGEPPKPKIKRPKKHKKVSILSKEQIREEPLR